jgi:hypothetical protein
VVCAPTSPLAWICEIGTSKKNDPDRETMIANRDSKDLIRNRTLKKFLRGDSDEEEDADPRRRQSSKQPTNNPETFRPNPPSRSALEINPVINKYHNGKELDTSSFAIYGSPAGGPGSQTVTGEARVVAPNVSRLSPNSAVEIRLVSSEQSVAVLCSVDVLKMRSTFFHDVLNEQERKHGFADISQSGRMDSELMGAAGILWRDPITVPEQTPFDAAAFLESLHEGRALFRGDWNYCWAKLR